MRKKLIRLLKIETFCQKRVLSSHFFTHETEVKRAGDMNNTTLCVNSVNVGVYVLVWTVVLGVFLFQRKYQLSLTSNKGS